MKKTNILIFNNIFLLKKLRIIIAVIIPFFLISSMFVYSFGVQQIIYSSDNLNIIKPVSSIQLSKELISSHIKIWKHSYEVDFNNWTSLEIINNLKDLLTLNIAQEMEMSTNKKEYLEKYLNDVYKALSNSNQKINELTNEIDKYDSKMQLCIMQKENSDSDFFSSIDTQDDSQMQNAINISKENAKCIWENKVEVNSRKALLTTITYYDNLLQKKYDYILPKKDIIIKHFDLMKDNLLEELFRTREVLLKNYNN